jgi:peroxiredoxin
MQRIFIIAALLLIAACAPAPAVTPIPPTAEGGGGLLEALVSATALPDERPAWQHIALTEARTGAAFTLANYAGRTIYVQPMSVGCGECFVQQEQVRAAKARLNADHYVFISVSAEPAAELTAFADQRNFDWLFASAPLDFFAGLVTTYGDGVTVLANAPHFVISPLGAVSTLATGQRSADQLIAELTAASGA